MNRGKATQPVDQPLFVVPSPSSSWASSVLMASGCLGSTALTIGLYTVGLSWFTNAWDYPALMFFGVVLASGIGLAVFLITTRSGLADRGVSRFYAYPDRLEVGVTGLASPESRKVVWFEFVRHFELMYGGRIRFRYRLPGENRFTEHLMAAGRLHAEDRFDELMDCVEIANPDLLCSIRQRRQGTQYSRRWQWSDAFPDTENACSARLGRHTASVGGREFVVQSAALGFILASDSKVVCYVRPSEIMDVDGFVLADVAVAGAGWRVCFGTGDDLQVDGLSGIVTHNRVQIGRISRPSPEIQIEVERPLPGLVLLTLLATSSYDWYRRWD